MKNLAYTAPLYPLHRVCDAVTGAFIFFSLLFSPWAFGTTERWSISIMNGAGYAIGALLFVKIVIRRFGNFNPQSAASPPTAASMRVTRAIGAITVLLLLWCWLNAWNASSFYSLEGLQFLYRKHISWLPSSLDASHSWRAFWNYLSLACSFWATRDWLLVRPVAAELSAPAPAHALPSRMRALLWLISANGALLALEGLLQRLDGTAKLLWIVQPHVNPEGTSHFGPYAYRSNAAQFLNLIWPMTLGFWFSLERDSRRSAVSERHDQVRHLLLSAVMLMAACPLFSDSRASAAVTAGLLVVSATLLVVAFRRESRVFRGALGAFVLVTLTLGLNLGWSGLRPRMSTLESDYRGREETCNIARRMAEEYPWFGTGPGTFDPLFQIYRSSPEEYWPAQAHNDWLETRVTFGNIGLSLLLAALLLVCLRWFASGGIATSWVFPSFIWLSLAGCLFHARFDFPFQIYSVLHLFLTECAILLCISRSR